MIKPFFELQKENNNFNPGIQGVYPKNNSYNLDNQYNPEPEIEPQHESVKKQEPEDPLEFVSMIVNFNDDESCKAPKFDDLLIIIEGYLAYIKQHGNEATKVNLSNIVKIPYKLLKALEDHFNFYGFLVMKRLFKKPALSTSARYKAKKFYTHFDAKLEKICNKKLKMLSKMNELGFLKMLENRGYITTKRA